MRLLLEANADVNAADSYQKQTALMWAAAEGHAEVVKALLAAKADPNRKAHVTALEERKHADHATGGFTALMFAARNGHEDAVRALVKGGADPKLTNGDGATATIIAIVNDRFDLAKTLRRPRRRSERRLPVLRRRHARCDERHARARRFAAARRSSQHDDARSIWSRCCSIAAPIPNKPFVGQLHSTTLCCGEEINASPFFRAAIAADVEALKLMIAKGAQVEWSPAEVKKEGRGPRGGGRGNERQRRQDADDDGAQRRPWRGVRGRPGIRSSGRTAVPRSVEPRAARGDQGAARRRRQSEREGIRTARRCSIRPSPRGRWRSSARSSRRARSSTPSTRTT